MSRISVPHAGIMAFLFKKSFGILFWKNLEDAPKSLSAAIIRF